MWNYFLLSLFEITLSWWWTCFWEICVELLLMEIHNGSPPAFCYFTGVRKKYLIRMQRNIDCAIVNFFFSFPSAFSSILGFLTQILFLWRRENIFVNLCHILPRKLHIISHLPPWIWRPQVKNLWFERNNLLGDTSCDLFLSSRGTCEFLKYNRFFQGLLDFFLILPVTGQDLANRFSSERGNLKTVQTLGYLFVGEKLF